MIFELRIASYLANRPKTRLLKLAVGALGEIR